MNNIYQLIPYCEKDVNMLGEKNKSIADYIVAILIALLPFLQHYKGVFINLAFSFAMLMVFYLIYKFIKDDKYINLEINKVLLPIILFQLVVVIKTQFSFIQFGYAGFITLILFFIINNYINLRISLNTAVIFGMFASITIFIQTLVFYTIKLHIRFIPTDFLLSGSDRWLDRALFGLNSAGEMYRPSGIFLEPSHYFLFVFPIILFLLLLPNFNKKRFIFAVVLSIGMLLSTSGLGIAVIGFTWFIFIILRDKLSDDFNALKSFVSRKTLIVILLFLIGLYFSYIFIPQINAIINRIFTNNVENLSAIDGRTARANALLGRMSFLEFLFGANNPLKDIPFHMPSFHFILYRYGIFSLIVFLYHYGQGLFKLKGAHFYLTIILIPLTFFTAHTHGTFFMIYYFIYLSTGYRNYCMRENLHNTIVVDKVIKRRLKI